MMIRIGCCVCLMAALLALSDSASGQPNKKKPGNKPGKPGNDQTEKLDGKKADVMFVLDVTGSMQFAIDGVEQGLEKILNKLKKNDIEARVGLTVFRDREKGNGNKPSANDGPAGIKGDPFTFTFKGKAAFTDKQKEFRAVVSKLKADGGGDIPENSLEGMKHAAEAKTRKGVSRIMILITDAPPHPGETLARRVENTRKALLSNKYHHLYLVCRPADRDLYQGIWSEEKGHKVEGAFFEISNTKAAFAGILEKVADQTVTDLKRRRDKAATP